MNKVFSLAVEVNATSPENAPSLRIDLGAVRSNFQEMRRRYHGQVLSAVVKSDAYGLGLEPVVRALVGAGCRDFWVNDLEEAARVRLTAPQATAYTLMGLAGADISDFEAVRAMPAVATLAELEHCARHAMLAGRRISIAVQVDTGLGRLGLCEEELAFLAGQPDMLAYLDIKLWVSHLAAYNLPDDPENAEQRRKLRDWVSALPHAPISLAASSGVFMPDDWHFDMARVGSALYGVQTSAVWQDGLIPCYELSAPVIRIAEFPAGRHLGYRGTTELKRPSRIATIAIGYANGLPQRFAEIGMVRFAGIPVRLVGGIAMNMTMIDLTDVPAGVDLVAERAVFLDRGQPVEPLAERLDCAPNVLLTQIGAATRRTYLKE
ncbi:alanine racemase [Mesorhizobium yinganensis]|uniref:alanine racemase n=1 Tax=Mesorhizobium yinganensis TaxID=3157707 RepID=UPI0032B74C0D